MLYPHSLNIAKPITVAARGLLRQPFLHFAVLGAVLFALHQWVAPRPREQIVVSSSLVERLRQDHLRRTGAVPTAEEEAALVQHYVDDEVLIREAVALGLDRGDVIVRRRLAQKMEFLLDSEAAPAQDADLRRYLQSHRQRYAIPPRVSLRHVFVSSERHGAESASVAVELRRRLLAGEDASRLGDPFLRGGELPPRSEAELAAIFGDAFAARVMRLPVGEWSAPVPSSFGLHLVHIEEKQPPRLPELDDIRGAVQRDFEADRRAEVRSAALRRLRQRYRVRIEDPEAPRLARLSGER